MYCTGEARIEVETPSRRPPGAQGVVSGDLSTIAGTRTVADEVNELGRFEAVIHNAGVGYREGRVETESGVPRVFAVNVLAPYILSALIERPKRLVYVSSGMHRGVRRRMDDLLWTKRSWSGSSAYAESKLCDVLLAFAVARRWEEVSVVGRMLSLGDRKLFIDSADLRSALDTR